ncbi:hypothetical protein EHS17_03855 [Rhodobacteraceae bacterium CH30]|nr:hypothetical protein EHS17_03855 [Rhodobacteraceae bacterium CH30]
MASFKTQKNGKTVHLSAKLPESLGGKTLNIGVSKVPEHYRPMVKAQLEGVIKVLTYKHKVEKLPNVDRTAEVRAIIDHKIHELYLQSLGMAETAVSFNGEFIHAPVTAIALPASTPEGTARALQATEVSPMALGHLVEEYFKAKDNEGIALGTLKAYGSTLRAGMLGSLGSDTPIGSVDYEMLMGKWLEEAFTKQSTNTQKAAIVRIKSFFTWALEVYPKAFPMGYKNPALRIKPFVKRETVDMESGEVTRVSKLVHEERAALTPEDAQKVNPKLPVSREEWFLKVSLFTGLRLNELAQLHRDDVIPDEENPNLVSLRVARTYTDQSLKNTSSERTLPLGFDEETTRAFLAFIDDNTKRYGSKSLTIWGYNFLKAQQSYSVAASKASRLAIEAALGANSGLTHHSFRHTIADKLKKAISIKDSAVKQFMGHSLEGDITAGRYGKPFTPEQLRAMFDEAGVWDDWR